MKQAIDQGQDYLRMLEEGFTEMRSFNGGEPETRLEYLSDHIFNFITYDSKMAELFAKKALEVCAAISDSKTFDYIKDADQYQWYLLMCNMPFFADKLSWGTSIRGAWWDTPYLKKIEYSSCGLFLDSEQLSEKMEFTREQWADFISAVRNFGVTPNGD